ncbi:glutaredoxin domain-containing cysteine-rich protein 2 isoform X1 [Dicentrarchus labrax]|uniref:glutaredoxin domain-containing cysteine-rich protein 2 isoform X1 n=1 Tax=Dicentrarchus labrax TaxID=13489 RepID=UPI0021F5A8C9|nr:glutaredoxin domain-containing cysteine-rich protein 2 isoform X1 [Dicentrarchus labrax]
MEELQRKLDQRYPGTKPRKVRFKLASSYSGRVLKHVYEDGQELDSPEEKYPHSFVHRKIPPSHLEVEQLCGFEDTHGDQQAGVYPPTGLIAQRINVYRGMGSYKPAAGLTEESEGDATSSVLDFGKIIIYTSNLRIIRAPPRKPEVLRHHTVPPVDLEEYPKAKERGSRRRAKALCTQDGEEKEKEKEKEKEEKQISGTETKEADSCQHCGGSGCAPCSLCHGSKLSMLANRFNESISDLRCQACYPHGLERCQSCSSK